MGNEKAPKEITTELIWSQIKEADRKLRRKFGGLLTDWQPTSDTVEILSNDQFATRWAELQGVQDNSNPFAQHIDISLAVAVPGRFLIAQERMASLLGFQLTAAHEMIHIHTMQPDGNVVLNVDWLKAHISGDEDRLSSNLVGEVITDYLAVKALKLFDREVDKLPPDVALSVHIAMQIAEITDSVGGYCDQELFKLLRGQEPTQIQAKMDEVYKSPVYGNEFFYRDFLPILNNVGLIQKFGSTLDATELQNLRREFTIIVNRAIALNGRAKYVRRPDFERCQQNMIAQYSQQ